MSSRPTGEAAALIQNEALPFFAPNPRTRTATGRAVDALCGYLGHDDALLRSAAARCLAAFREPAAAEPLAALLLDEDPDVRSDAMEALAGCPLPAQAETLRYSLEGDPVTEVKVAAIKALARLEDRGSLPLLRDLALDRCEETVAWEDEGGVWDDWLVVQTEAIAALGRLGESAVIPDLLAARQDEFAQDLDRPVFRALANLGKGGAETLLDFLRDPDAKVRARALEALAHCSPVALAALSDLLLRDPAPEVRRLSLETVAAYSAAATDLMLLDPDPDLRREAVLCFAAARPDVVRQVLRDPDEGVRAALLQLHCEGKLALSEPDLKENLLVWMTSGGPRLAEASLRCLARLAPDQAMQPLLTQAEEESRPLEVRLAALQALCAEQAPLGEDALERVGALLCNPVQQLRVAALLLLTAACDRGDLAAESLLLRAIDGSLGADPGSEQEETAEAEDAATPKDEEAAESDIAITPEGEIVSRREAAAAILRGKFPQTTLDSIQVERHPRSEGSPSPSQSRKARRRVAVEGPMEVAQDLQRQAVSLAGRSTSAALAAALETALASEDSGTRLAAFKALAERSRPVSSTALDQAASAIGETDAVLRGYAARILASSAAHRPLLEPLLKDRDPLLRAEALRALAPADLQMAEQALSDPAAAVRRAAVEVLLSAVGHEDLPRVMNRLADGGFADSLLLACKLSPGASDLLPDLLGQPESRRGRLLALMEAMAKNRLRAFGPA